MQIRVAFIAVAFAVVPSSLRAGVITFSNPNDFAAAIASRPTVTENFDSAAVGTTIGSGTSFGGITFTYDWQFSPNEQIRINDNNDTQSGNNYLGATNSTGTAVDFIADNNTITLNPDTPFSAIGLYVITADSAFDDDFTLTSSGTTASLTGGPLRTLNDNSEVFFLGLVEDTGAGLTSAELRASVDAGGVQLGYRIDDVIYAAIVAVPEPSSCMLASVMSLLLLARRRRM